MDCRTFTKDVTATTENHYLHTYTHDSQRIQTAKSRNSQAEMIYKTVYQGNLSSRAHQNLDAGIQYFIDEDRY